MAIINEHSGLEGSGIEESGLDDTDELHPKYLPRKDMLNLLVDLLIFNNSQSAVTALIAVCKSASDKPGMHSFNNRFLRERGKASNPKMEYQVFLCIFQKNSAMAT